MANHALSGNGHLLLGRDATEQPQSRSAGSTSRSRGRRRINADVVQNELNDNGHRDPSDRRADYYGRRILRFGGSRAVGLREQHGQSGRTHRPRFVTETTENLYSTGFQSGIFFSAKVPT